MSEQQQPLGFVEKFNSNVSYLWANHKIFLIVFGVLILLAKFSGSIMEFIAYLSKKELDKAVKKDQQLSAEEDAAKKAANQLVDDAKKLDQNKPSVDEDWHKKGK